MMVLPELESMPRTVGYFAIRGDSVMTRFYCTFVCNACLREVWEELYIITWRQEPKKRCHHEGATS